MGYFNKIVLLGNVTRNPEVRYIPNSGTPVAKFGLAVNRKYKSGDEQKEETLFVDVSAFARLAEIVGEYVAKGDPILIEGRLTFRAWEQDGQKRSKHEVNAENIQLLGRRRGSEGENESNSGSVSGGGSESDVPF